MNASIYKKINKYYKTINLEMINDIINKFNHILDLYIEYSGTLYFNEYSYGMFYSFNLLSLESIEGFEYVNTSNVIDMSYMFAWHDSLQELDLSNFNTSSVTKRNLYRFRFPFAN